MNASVRFETTSPAETVEWGRRLGRCLRRGDVVALSGPLGAGKTTLVGGIAEGLGAPPSSATSPTFALIHEYEGRERIFHIDWYRLENVSGTDRRLAEECFSSDAVTLVEWPEKGKNVLPREHIRVVLEHAGEGRRRISFRIEGLGRTSILKELR